MLLRGAFFVVATGTAVAAQDGDYTYTTSGSPAVATITGYTGAGGAITIPSTLGGYATRFIGESAFSWCTSLTSVTIPSSVTSIGNRAFAACSSLTAINVDEGNANYASVNGVLYNKAMTALILCPSGKAGAFTIPNSVTSIGDYAFYDCASLTSVIIGSGVTSIGAGAFYGCTSLTSVIIGSGVTSIGDYAFYDCASLTSIGFLGLVAPTTVGANWILGTGAGIRCHAYAASNFPAPGGVFHGLTMGAVISAVPGER